MSSDGVLYNRNEAGNVYWGAAAAKVNWSLPVAMGIVQGYTLLDEGSFDESSEQYAIARGYVGFLLWWGYSKEGLKSQVQYRLDNIFSLKGILDAPVLNFKHDLTR